MNLAEYLCLKMTYVFQRVRRHDRVTRFCGVACAEEGDHWQWQFETAQEDLALVADFISLAGKDVLDVGCGLGGKTAFYATQGPRNVVGVDTNPWTIERARRQAVDKRPDLYPQGLQFEICGEASLPFPDETFDVILTNDTFEHLSAPEPVLAECKRVLRKGGRVGITFQPWLSPSGHHLKRLVPIPWAHVFFSERTLIHVAAIRYDRDDYGGGAKFWEYGTRSGKRQPHPWVDRKQLPTVNKITLRQFNQLVECSDLTLLHYRLVGYLPEDNSTKAILLAPISHLLKRPPFNEYFTRAIVCVLSKG